MGWDKQATHGFTEVNEDMIEVSFKDKVDDVGEVTDTLIAPGHVPDIQPDVDHVHAWGQNTDQPDSHEMRHGPELFPM